MTTDYMYPPSVQIAHAICVISCDLYYVLHARYPTCIALPR